MKLSNETLQVLKNFAMINPNIVISKGNTIKTIAESKTVLAKAGIQEDIPHDIGIYDLNEFLNVLGLFADPDLEFDGSDSVYVSSGTTGVRYYLSDASVLTTPSKELPPPNEDFVFDLSTEMLGQLRKAASTLGVKDLVIETSEEKSVAKVTDLGNATSNSYELQLAVGVADPDNNDASLVFNIDNLKLIGGNYSVIISSNLIAQFVHHDLDLVYWVALEKSSTIGE